MRHVSEVIQIKTGKSLDFVDITDQVVAIVERAAVRNGFVNIQSKHTTAGVIVNENEPLVLQDMCDILESLAPQGVPYRHDDFSVRVVNMCEDEFQNGHAHCKALFIRTSETLNIVEGKVQFGRWQRVFLLELDRPRVREVSVVVLGD
ncbi:MAG: YjbQ family protein [Deltaproteobacteria bacterium]|nr:YjbQ family protein [Deltaproteobacteria bacterium]MBI3078485.1 YjbQ family protein [Deltaproteobacteria bacterium]